jgi:hypothetical protein
LGTKTLRPGGRRRAARDRQPTIDVVGGTEAISEEVATAAAQAGGGTAARLAGATRFATSVAVAGAGAAWGPDGDALWVATGRNFPDALAAGPAAALAGSPLLLLIDGLDPDGAPERRAWLRAQADRLDAALVVGRWLYR